MTGTAIPVAPNRRVFMPYQVGPLGLASSVGMPYAADPNDWPGGQLTTDRGACRTQRPTGNSGADLRCLRSGSIVAARHCDSVDMCTAGPNEDKQLALIVGPNADTLSFPMRLHCGPIIVVASPNALPNANALRFAYRPPMRMHRGQRF